MANMAPDRTHDVFSSLRRKRSGDPVPDDAAGSSARPPAAGPALPPPEIGHPFPVLEQPARCLFTSLDPRCAGHRLTSTRKGKVGVSRSRGEREQFLLVPAASVDATEGTGNSENADGADGTGTVGKKAGRDRYYLKSYKFGRYLTPDSSGSVGTADGGDDGRSAWILMRSPHGGHFLISASDERNLGCEVPPRGATQVRLGASNGASESWEVEFVSGELCFLSSPENLQLRCDLAGRTTLTLDRRGWEVWRFVEAGGGAVRIVSWMHAQFCLTCDHGGAVSAAAVGADVGGCDTWTVETAPDKYGGVLLKSVACARRVLCRRGGGLATTQELEGGDGVWRLDAAHSQTYALGSLHRANTIGPFPYVTKSAKQSDHWIVQQTDDGGTVRLYHKARGQYLASPVAGAVGCVSTAAGDTLWKMAPGARGGYTFSSLVHGALLAFDADDRNPQLCTAPAETDGGRETWRVDPILPRAISSTKIKTFALGASVAVGTTVAMPFLMAGMLAIVPAEATLAASILGVGLTSAEAIASVGAIGATAAIVFRESGDTLGIEAEKDNDGHGKDYTKRPLSAWRSW